MKAISRWGKNHPQKTRVIIGFSHALLVLNALWLGFLCYSFNWQFSPWLILACASIFAGAYFMYPYRKDLHGLFKYSYAKQKTLDSLFAWIYPLALSAAFAGFCAEPMPVTEANSSPFHLVAYPAQVDTPMETPKSRRQLIKAELRQLKQELNTQSNIGPGITLAKFGLIVLTVTVAVFLGLMVGALSCNLSCSGNQGLAAFVLIFGWSAIIFLGIMVVRHIIRREGKNRIEKQPAEEDSLKL